MIICHECRIEVETIYYPSAEEVGHAVNWSGWRALYFNLENNIDFCGPICSTKWYERNKNEAL